MFPLCSLWSTWRFQAMAWNFKLYKCCLIFSLLNFLDDIYFHRWQPRVDNSEDTQKMLQTSFSGLRGQEACEDDWLGLAPDLLIKPLVPAVLVEVLKAVVLILWLLTPVRWPAYQIFTSWFVTVAKLQVWSSNKKIYSWVVKITWGTLWKGCSIRKVEDHCSKENCFPFPWCLWPLDLRRQWAISSPSWTF